jgi:ketosteroid isomerase-like protein
MFIGSRFSPTSSLLTATACYDFFREVAMDSRWKTVFGAAVEKEITTKAAFAMGDLAYETGSYTFTIVAEGKEARAVKGRYVEVWKKQTDGSWKMYRDIGLPD